MSHTCPCGSGIALDDCCGKWHQGQPAPSAERLMRSRYSAYTLSLIDYLVATTLPAQQAALDRLLRELSAAGIAVVMSSHDLNHTLRHAGQSWLLCQGEAIACGETAEVLNEENLTAAYAIPFQRVEVAGHIMLIASQ